VKEAALVKSHRGLTPGAASCTSCHDPHVSPKKKLVRDVGHSPFIQDDCSGCHEMKGDVVSAKLVSSGRALCESCHSDLGDKLNKAFAHTPVKKGECASCHSPHAAREEKLLVGAGQDLCFRCHGKEKAAFSAKKAVHTPVKNGECLKCHDAHSSAQKNGLAKAGAALCLSCHEDIKGLLKQKVTHQPAKDGDCNACHDPHATDHRAQLVSAPARLCANCHDAKQLEPKHRGYSLAKADCLTCHDPHGSAQAGLIRSQPHPVLRSCSKCHKDSGAEPQALVAKGNALCFRCHSDKRVALSKPGAHEGAKGDCLACHNPHASNDRGLSAGRERDACLACHAEVKHTVATSRTIHPEKVEKGKCSICHEPHQTANPRLLVRKEEELCQKCHSGHAQFGHPVGPNVIDPRTQKPVTCLSCHSPHGTQFSSILLDNPSQALCVRCHDPNGAMGGKKRGGGAVQRTSTGH
jgi:predicted CXXCH cytochrome family protein